MSERLNDVAAVVFDLDDTLYPERAYVQSGFRAVSRQIALLEPDLEGQAVYEQLLRAFEEGERGTVFGRVLEELGRKADDQEMAELVSLYRCHRPVLELEEPVRWMLEQLGGKYKLGLLTDGTLPGQKLKVEALGLEGKFDHIVYTEELGRQYWKPAVRGFEEMASQLGCAHEQCVYIADNPSKDFLGPNALGWQSVQVARPERVHLEVLVPPDGQAQRVVGVVTDVLQVL